jgi:hypothetical protein
MLFLANATLSVFLTPKEPAQAAPGARFCGSIQDPTGAPLSGASVH